MIRNILFRASLPFLTLLTLAAGCARETAPEPSVAQAPVVAPEASPASAPEASPASAPGASPVSVAASLAPAGEVRWEDSFAAATKRARAENKLIMVDFWATWCGWCKRLDADVYSTAEFARAARDIVAVKVNVEGSQSESEIAQRYNARNLPTILYLTPEGKVLQRIGGYMPADRFVPTVTQAVELYRSLPALKAKFAAEPQNWDIAQKMTEIYATLEDANGLEKAVTRIKALDPPDKKGYRARALILLGSSFARQEKIDRATTLFEQALAAARDAQDKATARRSVAVCYAIQKNFARAEKNFQAILDDAESPEEARRDAEQFLERIRQQAGGKPG